MSDETLASFAADVPSSTDAETTQQSGRPAGRQGLFLLLGMVACVAVGAVTVFTWFI